MSDAAEPTVICDDVVRFAGDLTPWLRHLGELRGGDEWVRPGVQDRTTQRLSAFEFEVPSPWSFGSGLYHDLSVAQVSPAEAPELGILDGRPHQGDVWLVERRGGRVRALARPEWEQGSSIGYGMHRFSGWDESIDSRWVLLELDRAGRIVTIFAEGERTARLEDPSGYHTFGARPQWSLVQVSWREDRVVELVSSGGPVWDIRPSSDMDERLPPYDDAPSPYDAPWQVTCRATRR
jgi:hypothetical protein